MATTLAHLNTISLAASTPEQLVASGPGNYTLSLLNTGTGTLAISHDSTFSSYFTLPAGQSFSISVWGPDGVWVRSSAAGSISVALIPR